jgi:hypothetical protein
MRRAEPINELHYQMTGSNYGRDFAIEETEYIHIANNLVVSGIDLDQEKEIVALLSHFNVFHFFEIDIGTPTSLLKFSERYMVIVVGAGECKFIRKQTKHRTRVVFFKA